VGCRLGDVVGIFEDGVALGPAEGDEVGLAEGALEGQELGRVVGPPHQGLIYLYRAMIPIIDPVSLVVSELVTNCVPFASHMLFCF